MLTHLFLAMWMGMQPRTGAEVAAAERALPTPLEDYSVSIVEGFTVYTHPTIGGDLAHRRVRAALMHDLWVINHVVPGAALAVIRTVPVVITPSTEKVEGISGRGMVFHPSAGWLTEAGFDAEREGTVEICNIEDFLTWRAEQPGMVLHEFAHAYHWILGFERVDVAKAFEKARASGLYASVQYVLDEPGESRRAYAVNNPREYFAELTEAYFGRNDYFPFTREELETYDPVGFALVARLWNLTPEEIAEARSEASEEP